MTASSMGIDTSDLDRIHRLEAAVNAVIIGKATVVKLMITSLLARGHILLEDAPGVGKTAIARALARSIQCSFQRIQFTPDLLPTDITGLSIYDPDLKEFNFKPGPIFANVVLADEINRAMPRIQSALLESMSERQVSVDRVTHPLPDPFIVIATQNPIEFIGTYPLPESQLDRFLMLLHMGYPSREEELEILASRERGDPIDDCQPVWSEQDAHRLCTLASEVRMTDPVRDYIVDLAQRTRGDRELSAGISPRGTLQLAAAARAHALVEGRNHVVPDDVKAVAIPVLTHRIVPRQAAGTLSERAAARDAVERLLEETPVPA